MIPISSEMQELLQTHGTQRRMMAYYNHEEPSRYEIL